MPAVPSGAVSYFFYKYPRKLMTISERTVIMTGICRPDRCIGISMTQDFRTMGRYSNER